MLWKTLKIIVDKFLGGTKNAEVIAKDLTDGNEFKIVGVAVDRQRSDGTNLVYLGIEHKDSK